MSVFYKIAILLIILTPAPAAFSQINVGEKAPSIVLKDLKGKTARLEDFKGKIILINFWATWCVPCRAEIPELVKWQQGYQSSGLQIIGITYPQTKKTKVRAFARRQKMIYPFLFGSKKIKELFDSGDTLPYSIVIDREGNIKDRIEGVIFSEEFDEKIEPLLETDSEKKDSKTQ